MKLQPDRTMFFLLILIPMIPLIHGQGCGGEYNSTSGTIIYPLRGNYPSNARCTWIIRVGLGAINISFVRFETEKYDKLTIRDGESSNSKVLHTLSGKQVPSPFQTRKNAAHLYFNSDGSFEYPGFELHWVAADAPIQTFNSVHLNSDYEVRINFPANPEPTALKWHYGPNFQEMPNLIQVPSDNGKFSTSLIDLENDNYQVLLKIVGVTEEDYETMFKLNVANEIAETNYRVKLIGCGGDYNSSSGMIRHPLSGDTYDTNENCTWIIRAGVGFIKFTIVSFDTEEWDDRLIIRDGESTESNVLYTLSGSNNTLSFHTSTEAAHLSFTSDRSDSRSGFEFHWEPADAPIQTFYSVHLNSDYEVRFNFSANPQPTVLEWFYGPNFQEMPNIIQIPSDNGKFSTSLIDLENGNYQVLLRIVGITEEDHDTKFKLHVANEIGDTNYRVLLSATPNPPSSLQLSLTTSTEVHIAWDYSVDPGDISYYVIQYKPKDADQDYEEISDISTKFYTVIGLTDTTEYEFQVLAVNKFGRGPPSEPSYLTTMCGVDYSSSSGMFRHPMSGGNYKNNENCTWIISVPIGTINITFASFNTSYSDVLIIRDGESSDSKQLLNNYGGHQTPKPVHTSSNTAYMTFKSDSQDTKTGFELHWEIADASIQTYKVPLNSDYDIELNFYSNPQPTVFEWSYGPNFQDMPNLIQIPSDNEKFSTSLIELGDGNYQAVLRIIGVTEDDLETKFMLHVANNIGEANYRVELYGCGGEYSSSSGMIRHPFIGSQYKVQDNCTWIIKAADSLKITFTRFDTYHADKLYIRDGEGIESNVLGEFSGNSFNGNNVPRPVLTSTNTVQLNFKQNMYYSNLLSTGFELEWEPAVETFYQVLHDSDHEVRHNFSSISQPTALKWSYGDNFQEMPNLIQVPSDNGKFSTSLVELENGTYQALLGITGVTKKDLETKFKLHVTNEIGEIDYRVTFSAFAGPPSTPQIGGNITSISVALAWNNSVNPGDISSYVIQYKPSNATQGYTHIFDIATKFYTVRGLSPLTEYKFRVLSVNKMGPGPPSEPFYVTTASCGGEYNSSNGFIRHPFSGFKEERVSESCVWIIKGADHTIDITFFYFDIGDYNSLYLRDGDSFDSNVLQRFTGNHMEKRSFQTNGNSVHLFFSASDRHTRTGFELQWKPAVKTFHQISMDSDYEIQFKFPLKSRPSALEWSYGPNFQEMHNIIQIPSDNGKFSTSIINLKNREHEWQALLRISRVTKEDIETKFKLHVSNKNTRSDFRVTLSESPLAPLNLQFPDIMQTLVQITWNYNVNPGSISSYVIQYKPNEKAGTDYTEISDINTMSYTVRGLKPSTKYDFRVLAVNNFGRGQPSEFSSVTTASCGMEYNSSRGTIRYPLNGTYYKRQEECTWIIRATDSNIIISISSLDTEEKVDHLTIRDGESCKSKVIGKFSGDYVPRTVQTSTNVANLHFISGWHRNEKTGFELHWEPADPIIHTVYQIPMHSDYEVKFNFYASPQPTAVEWFYGPNFQEMSNLIQIPSDNGKFSTSLIDLEKGNYQALLRIAGITEEDINTKFKLHVGEDVYRVTLSAYPQPPSLKFSEILPTLVKMTWTYTENLEDISYYVIQYKPRTANQDYTEISGIATKFYTVRDLTPSTEYEFRVSAVYKTGRGPPSESSYVTTVSCGGEYNSTSGTIKHTLSTDYYKNQENCIWIIRVPIATINITFGSYGIRRDESLYVRDGDNIESKVLKELGPYDRPKPIHTSGNSVHLQYIPNLSSNERKSGFEIHWEYTDAAIQNYHIPIHSDFEVRLNFAAIPQPTTLKWSYGVNFTEMHNLIQIPSDNGKFRTSLIDDKNGNYQAILKIVGVTEKDIEPVFMLHVVNEIGQADYRVMLNGCGGEYNSSSGIIRHPLKGNTYHYNDKCTWIIRAADRINITFIRFNIDSRDNMLYIRDGDNSESKKLGKFSGKLIPWPVQTSTSAAHLFYKSGDQTSYYGFGGFELHWELADHKVPACSGLFTPVGESCLLLAITERLTWSAAREYCKALGADLVVIKDANHYVNTLGYIGRTNGDNTAIDLWIGGSDEATEGHWVWVTGELMPRGTPFWGSLDGFVAEPSGGDSENCAGLSHHDRYYMHDFACTLKHAPLCQKIPA